ncbi:sensor histidine kinase [Brachybacterium sp. FME24]|uniref:sensor histidine kinase n=1 Tax=Brachybacterium sp. FME24 TaxID=2742605 RepID=UPI001868AD75|nr:sensor histidine kinase [Brachybacterium sp. FME24]
MSIEAELGEELDRWERREHAVIMALPFLLLAVSTLITLLQAVREAPVHVPAVLGLTVATAIWVFWFITLHPRWHRSGPLMGLYYAGLMALAAGLVVLAPWYGIFAFVGYVHAFVVLTGRWRYVGLVTTSMIMAVTYMGGIARIGADEWWLWLAISLVSAGLAATFVSFIENTDQQWRQQKRALDEVHEANVKLEEALAENAELQAQLLVQAREAGVLDERQRMAREIHDTLAQSLAGILTQLQAAEQSMEEPFTLRRHMSSATSLARESLTDARRTILAVEPELLADARLPDAISDVTRSWSELNHIDAVLTTTGDPRPMHADVEVTLLRAAQEALNNVAKHAKAHRVGLTLSYMEDLVTLDVRDDGIGFEPDARRADGTADGGFGLLGMRQRVQRLAGRLDIESEPGGGTAISATVPAISAGAEQ